MKEPVALSPREFAALFEKEQTWGYWQIYAGKVKTITEYGRTMIPAAEVERIVGAAAIFNERKRPAPAKRPTKAALWMRIHAARKKANESGKGKRSAALARLRRS